MPKKSVTYAPRVINPIKIEQVLIFSAAEELQKAAKTLKRDMPRVTPRVLTSPKEAMQIPARQASVLICDDTALNLLDAAAIKKRNPDLVIALLSSVEVVSCSPPQCQRRSSRMYPGPTSYSASTERKAPHTGSSLPSSGTPKTC